MGARNQCSCHQFSCRIYRRYIDRNFFFFFRHCCFWLREKLVEYPRLLIISPWSLNDFWNPPRCAKYKSLLHGPHNYVDRTYEWSANYSASTFSCYRAKPKCNFAVRPLYDRSTMLGCLLQTVWVCILEKKRKQNLGNSQKCLRQWSEWNFWRAINVQCVTRVGTVFLDKIPWKTSPWIFQLVSDSGPPYNNC